MESSSRTVFPLPCGSSYTELTNLLSVHVAGHPPGLLSIHAICQTPPGYEMSLSTDALGQ